MSRHGAIEADGSGGTRDDQRNLANLHAPIFSLECHERQHQGAMRDAADAIRDGLALLGTPSAIGATPSQPRAPPHSSGATSATDCENDQR
jgi:hypothetical protein